MIIRISKKGPFETLGRHILEYRDGQSLDEWVRDSFAWHLPILFIGSVGIAVRHIAPYLENKLTDSPVLVMDDAGSYVIPILSGHVGGANELAREIASYVGAKAVITTATDVFHKFAIDVFAKEHGLGIYNQDAIRIVSRKVLDDKTIRMKCSSLLEPVDASVREYLRSSQVELVEEREEAGRETEGREVEGREATGREEAGIEEAEREVVGREEVGREEVGREEAGIEEEEREVVGREAVGREAVGREEVGREEAGIEEAGRETAEIEAEGIEAAGIENVGNEAEGIETAGREIAGIEAEREDVGRDAVRDGFGDEVYITTKEDLDNLSEAGKLSDTTLYLYPLQYVIGIGCVQGKSKEELFDFIEEMLRELESHQGTKGDIKREIYALASIDRKAYEPGLLAVSAYYKCPLLTFAKEELETVTKVSEESEFVCRTVGIGNVCERAALYAAGEGAELLMKKVKRNGMTLAIAKRRAGMGGYYE